MRVICKNLNFSYSKDPLIKNFNLEVSSGQHVLLRGQSGSGKSSLLKLISGIIDSPSGQILLDKFDILSQPLEVKKSFRLINIGYVHQENHLIEHWTVAQNLSLISRDLSKILPILVRFNLAKIILDKKVSTLSGGEKQRISLTRILLQKPKLALLDEPTSHLDDKNTTDAIQFVLSELAPSTIILVSHDSRLSQLNLTTYNFSELNK